MIENILNLFRSCCLYIILLAGFSGIKQTKSPGNMRVLLLSVIILFACVSASFALKAYPNPWIPEGASNTHGNLAAGITFGELPNAGGEIYIYNTTGELVRKLVWTCGENKTNWDGKNDQGEYVASGVYLWVIKDSGESKASKIVVIR